MAVLPNTFNSTNDSDASYWDTRISLAGRKGGVLITIHVVGVGKPPNVASQ
jgi:hypothetical protein